MQGNAPSDQAETSFIVIPADYYQEYPGVLNAAKYYPVSVTVYPVWSNYDQWDVCVDWGAGAGGLCSLTQNGTSPVKLDYTYNTEGTYTVTVSVRACNVNSLGFCQWQTVKQESFDVRVTAPWYEYSETVRNALENTPEDGGTIEQAVIRALKKVGIGLAGAWADITDFLASWMSQLGIQPGDAYYYLVAMPTTDNMPAIKTVYNEYRYWGTWIIFLLALVAILWKGLFNYEEGGEALFKWLRDLLLVLAGLYLALPLYDAAAKAWNVMTLSIARLDQLGAIYVMFTVGILLLSAVGMLNPSAGVLAANMTIVLLLTIVLGVLKWITAAVLVAILPLAIALWLWEGTRSIAASVFRMLTGLFVFTAAAAALTALTVEFSLTLTQTGTGKNLLFAAALPIISTIAGYWVTSAIMPGALPGSGLIAYRMLGRGAGGAAAATVAGLAAGGLAAGKTQMTTAVQPGIEPGTSHAMSGAVIGAVPLPALVKSPEPHVVASGAPGEPIIPGKHGISYTTETKPGTPYTLPTIQGVKPPVYKPLKPIENTPLTKLKEWTSIAKGELEVETPQPTIKNHLYTGSAKIAGKLATNIKQTITAFDQILAKETGITITKPIQRIKPLAKHAIKTAELVSPRILQATNKTISWLRAHRSGLTIIGGLRNKYYSSNL